jgi:Chaperone of endosialidase
LQISNAGAVWFHKGPLTVGRSDGPSDPLLIWSAAGAYARAKFRVDSIREYSAGTWPDAFWKVTDESLALVRFAIGGDGVTFNTFGSWSVISDARLKTEQAEYATGLEEICRLRPITFRYNGQSGTDPKARHIGLLGQDVASIMPEIVTAAPDEMVATSPGLLVYPLINAVRELNNRVRALENAAG